METHSDLRVRFKPGKQGELLKTLQATLGLSQRKVAELLKVKRRTYRNWLEEKNTLPLSIFLKICDINPELSRFKHEIEEILPTNWGKSKGGYKRAMKEGKHWSKLMNLIRQEKRCLVKYGKVSRLIRKEFRHMSKKNALTYLAVSILMDGTIEQEYRRISFYTKDPILRDLVDFLFRKVSRYKPRVTKANNGVFIVRLVDKEVMEDLFSLSPTYKIKPGKKQSIDEYLKEPQPSVEFLLEESDEVVKKSIRIAMSTSGSVSVNGSLILGCSNPELGRQWEKIFRLQEFHLKLRKSKDVWSGYMGLGSNRTDDLLKFKEIGGFIEGVKSYKSKHFKGLEKNKILNYVLRRAGVGKGR